VGKIIRVLNIKTGFREIELPYTQEQEDRAKSDKAFTINNVNFSGYCMKCSHPVLAIDSSILVNMDGLGNVSAEVFHNHCSQ